jgi:hypothetical protein
MLEDVRVFVRDAVCCVCPQSVFVETKRGDRDSMYSLFDITCRRY